MKNHIVAEFKSDRTYTKLEFDEFIGKVKTLAEEYQFSVSLPSAKPDFVDLVHQMRRAQKIPYCGSDPIYLEERVDDAIAAEQNRQNLSGWSHVRFIF